MCKIDRPINVHTHIYISTCLYLCNMFMCICVRICICAASSKHQSCSSLQSPRSRLQEPPMLSNPDMEGRVRVDVSQGFVMPR